MALLEITADDRAAVEHYGKVREWGCLVATGWEPEGRYSVPWFQFANGKRVNLGLPDLRHLERIRVRSFLRLVFCLMSESTVR